MIDFVQVGEKIMKYRKEAKMTQDDLANQLFITRQALSKWENGTSAPSIDSLFALCQLFHVSFEELLCLNEDTALEVPQENIFQGHDRLFILHQILSHDLVVDIPDVFYQMSPMERLQILKAIRNKKLDTDIERLKVKCTTSECHYLGGKEE
jgi:DNA-binding XRE family transcriptional regulator